MNDEIQALRPLPARYVLGGYEIGEDLRSADFEHTQLMDGRRVLRSSFVYAAENTATGDKVVVKELVPYAAVRAADQSFQPETPGDETGFRHSVQQFSLLADECTKFKHAYIVPVIDSFSENNTVYLVMPFIQGLTLYQARERGVLTTEHQLHTLLCSALLALRYLHSLGCLHADIKPSNMMMAGTGEGILIDTASCVHIGDTSAPVFSGCFSPPEQSPGKKEKLTAASDIYSLGATFYSLVYGHTPGCHTSSRPIPCGDAFLRGIETALSPSPGNRWQSAEAWLVKLVDYRPMDSDAPAPDVKKGKTWPEILKKGKAWFTILKKRQDVVRDTEKKQDDVHDTENKQTWSAIRTKVLPPPADSIWVQAPNEYSVAPIDQAQGYINGYSLLGTHRFETNAVVYAAKDDQGRPCELVEFAPWFRCARASGALQLEHKSNDFDDVMLQYLSSMHRIGMVNLEGNMPWSTQTQHPDGSCFFANGTVYLRREPLHTHFLWKLLDVLPSDARAPQLYDIALARLLDAVLSLHREEVFHGNINLSSVMEHNGELIFKDFYLGTPHNYYSYYSEDLSYFTNGIPFFGQGVGRDLYMVAAAFHKLLVGYHRCSRVFVFHAAQQKRFLADNEALCRYFNPRWLATIDKAFGSNEGRESWTSAYAWLKELAQIREDSR